MWQDWCDFWNFQFEEVNEEIKDVCVFGLVFYWLFEQWVMVQIKIVEVNCNLWCLVQENDYFQMLVVFGMEL